MRRSSVSVVDWTTGWTTGALFPTPCTERLQGPPSLLSDGYMGLFPRR